jgi:hypothetical protein
MLLGMFFGNMLKLLISGETTTTQKYVKLSVEGLKAFAIFFLDTKLLGRK